MTANQFDTDAPESVAPAAPNIAEVLPIAGTVTTATASTPGATATPTAAPKAGKTAKTGKKAKPYHYVRAWGWSENNLTEAEGQMLATLHKYHRAQTDAVYQGELDATELLEAALYAIKGGKLDQFAEDAELTAEETHALTSVYAVWQRWAQQHEKIARLAGANQQAEAKEANRQAKQQKKRAARQAQALAPVLETLGQRGYNLLPDQVAGYAAVLVIAHPEKSGATALALSPVDTLPVLLLSTKADRQEQDTAVLIDLARRVPVPVGSADHRLDSPWALALAPSEVYFVGAIEAVSGRPWTGAIGPYADVMKDAAPDVAEPVSDAQEIEFLRVFRSLDQAHKDVVAATMRETQTP